MENRTVAKPYIRKGFLKYEKMRKYLVIFEEGRYSYMTLQMLHSELPIYEENLIFFFISTVPRRLFIPALQ